MSPSSSIFGLQPDVGPVGLQSASLGSAHSYPSSVQVSVGSAHLAYLWTHFHAVHPFGMPIPARGRLRMHRPWPRGLGSRQTTTRPERGEGGERERECNREGKERRREAKVFLHRVSQKDEFCQKYPRALTELKCSQIMS